MDFDENYDTKIIHLPIVSELKSLHNIYHNFPSIY